MRMRLILNLLITLKLVQTFSLNLMLASEEVVYAIVETDEGTHLREVINWPFGNLLRGENEETVRLEKREDLMRSMRSLPRNDRIVVALYYFADMTLAEVGKVMGLSESRVCQLKDDALELMRQKRIKKSV